MKTWFKIALVSFLFVGTAAQAARLDDCPLKNTKKSILLSDNRTNFIPASSAASRSQNNPQVNVGN